MAAFGFFLAVLFGCASVLFYTANDLRTGNAAWAHDVCAMAHSLCLHPEWMAIASGVAICGVIVVKLAAR
jgi:hypothetical protein